MNQPLAISATVDIDATPAEVWRLVSDLTRMPEFSPELRKVIRLGAKRDEPRIGTWLIGINRRKAVVWPTTSRVVRWEPGKAVAWRTRESGATWIYELTLTSTGTSVTGRRVLPGYTLGSKLLTPVLGGAAGHDEELAAGIRTTLERMKATLEA